MKSALDVRRRVYIEENEFTLPIPDRYDHRSWLLLAEHVETEQAVGTLRLTPRALGPLEAEEHFSLPDPYRAPDTVEIGRFAVLPIHRTGVRATPVVFLGLIRLMVQLLLSVGVQHLVAGATSERIASYRWLNMESTGMTARYAALKGEEVTLLTSDLQEALERGHEFLAFFLDDGAHGDGTGAPFLAPTPRTAAA